MTHRRTPRPLALAIERLAPELAPATLLAEVQAAWRGAVGAAIAAEATPVGERAGTVTLGCSSAVWAAELDLLGPTLIEQLNAALGRPAVQRLRPVVRRS